MSSRWPKSPQGCNVIWLLLGIYVRLYFAYHRQRGYAPVPAGEYIRTVKKELD